MAWSLARNAAICWLLVAGILVAQQQPEPFPADEVLYRWQAAITQLRSVAPLVDREELPEAIGRLAKLANELPYPYAGMATELKVELHKIAKQRPVGLGPDPSAEQPVYRAGEPWLSQHRYFVELGGVCCSLGDRERGLRLLLRAVDAHEQLAPSRRKPPFEWSFERFELTESELLLLQGRLKLDDRGQQRLAAELDEVRGTNFRFTKADQIVRRRNFGLVLEGLTDLHAQLSPETPYSDRLNLYRATATALGSQPHKEELAAWQSMLLLSFPAETATCAQVYYYRGLDAYQANRLADASAHYEKIVRDYPAWRGPAQLYLGFILQRQRRFKEAIARFERVLQAHKEALPGPDLMTPILDLHQLALDGLVRCCEATGDYRQALKWLDALFENHQSRIHLCGNCADAERASYTIWQARLLAKAGQRAESLAILEPLVFNEDAIILDGSAVEVWLLVDLYDKPAQVEAFAKKVEVAKRRMRWEDPRLPEGDRSVAYLFRSAEDAVEMARIAKRRNPEELWEALVRQDLSALEIYSTQVPADLFVEDLTPRYEARRRAQKLTSAIVSLKEEALPLLSQKLRGIDREKGLAAVLIAQIQPPQAAGMLERAAARSLAGQQPNPYSLELRRDICCAIALHNTDRSRQLMAEYGIGTTNPVFGPADLESLRSGDEL